ncbi:MAG: transglycosylase domain-containing protein, partial [Deltaproteobacteria bacterium]|nr:transglycosylase domain-containing protein [Deltaproteobacteria bacterium]
MAYQWLHGKMTSTTGYWPAYQWRSLEEISPFLVRAVLSSEDQRFFSHHGFDFIEMNKAI